MGTQLEIRDVHLNPVPSDVGKDDIRRALAEYNVQIRRVKVFERTSNGTRYAFVTPDSNIDYMRMMEIGVLQVNGSAIKISESIVKTKYDYDSYHNARISALLREVSSLGINLQEILSEPPIEEHERHHHSRTSCHTFHAVQKNLVEVRLARSLIVDSRTNMAQDPCRLTRSPLVDAPYDDIRQEETDLAVMCDFYCTPEKISSNFPQRFETGGQPAEGQEASVPIPELGSSNSMLRSSHLERTQRKKHGVISSHCHKADILGRGRSVSEDSLSNHRTCSSRVLSSDTSSDSSSSSSSDSSFSGTVQSDFHENVFCHQNFTSGLTTPPLSPSDDKQPPQLNTSGATVDKVNLPGKSNSLKDPETSLLLEENLALLTFFREELREMVKNEDFDDFEGTAFQAVHIFGVLIDSKLLSQTIVHKNTDVVLANIAKNESRVSTVNGLVKEIEDEDSENELLEELKEEIEETELILREEKADLLILKIANVIEHITTKVNRINPETDL